MIRGNMHLLRSGAFLAVLLTLQVFAADIPTPFSNSYDLSCSTQAGLVGSYKPANLSDPEVQRYGTLVFQDWWSGNYSMTSCTPSNAIQTGTNITAACSQVVAGMNYALLLKGFAKCPSNDTADPSVLTQANVTLAAKIYQPLGNASALVTYSKLVDLEEDEL